MFRIYKKYVLPRMLNRGMGPVEFNKTRSKIASKAYGTVLEIGFGSGYNLPFFKGVDKVYALEPSSELYSYAKHRIENSPFPIEHLHHSAEHIPLAENTIDSVISTWSLCSIPNLSKALEEVIRVLKPGGKFIFVEHGQSSKKLNYIAQKLATPVTRVFKGNCHLDRKIDAYIKDSGLIIENIEMFPEEGRPLMFSYRGIAVKK